MSNYSIVGCDVDIHGGFFYLSSKRIFMGSSFLVSKVILTIVILFAGAYEKKIQLVLSPIVLMYFNPFGYLIVMI